MRRRQTYARRLCRPFGGGHFTLWPLPSERYAKAATALCGGSISSCAENGIHPEFSAALRMAGFTYGRLSDPEIRSNHECGWTTRAASEAVRREREEEWR
jgi:hypothetical protein